MFIFLMWDYARDKSLELRLYENIQLHLYLAFK